VVLRSGEAPGDGRGTAKPVPPVGAAGGGAAPTPIVPALPGGRTVVTPKTKLDVTEDSASLMPLGGTTSLKQLVDALNALGVKPRDLIAVLQALKAANALQAELVLM
jgi:flagellar P-ring protein precursor FlgI